MARTVTLATMRTKVRQRADAENDPHVTDAEIDGLINDAYTFFYDKLIESCPPDYFRTTYTFNTADGTVAYALPSDFYKLRQVYSVENSVHNRPLEQVDEVARRAYRAPDAVNSMRLDYIPVASTLSDDSDTIDGINGWDELVVLTAAIDIKNKKEDDATPLLRKQRMLLERVEKMAPRDEGSPRHIIRRRYPRAPFRRFGYSATDSSTRQDVDGYTLVGGNIEIYRFHGTYIP